MGLLYPELLYKFFFYIYFVTYIEMYYISENLEITNTNRRLNYALAYLGFCNNNKKNEMRKVYAHC